jgi:hypothetical protein
MRLSVRIPVFAGALLLSVFALHAQTPAGWVYEGCWSPYPNCIGARDVFHDADGYDWECGMCGTSAVNPNPSLCMQGGGLHDEERQGRWCTPEDVEELSQ